MDSFPLLLEGMATSTFWRGESLSQKAMTGTFTYDASLTIWWRPFKERRGRGMSDHMYPGRAGVLTSRNLYFWPHVHVRYRTQGK